jgi:hypothetical protein
VAAVALLSVLQLAPGSRPPPPHLAELVPWRPTLAMRFTGQMAAMNEPLAGASDWNGYVTMTLAGLGVSDPARLHAVTRRAARRVADHCRCRVRGYEVRARIPGRGVLVVVSSAD